MAADDWKNVRISFWNHVKTQFNSLGYNVSSSGNVKYEGKDFNTDGVTKWIEPYILNTVSSSRRSANRKEQWLFQVNCFTKSGPGQENAVEIMQLAGDVRQVFEYQTIDVKDWDAVGDPHDVYLVIGEVNQEPIPTDTDNLMMRACTFSGIINE